MKISLCTVILFLMIGHELLAQIDSTSTSRNVIYLEMGGPGGYGSINYERVLGRNNDFLYGLRIGFATYHLKDYTNKFNPDILIPFAINGCYGATHKIECSIGQTLAAIVHTNEADFKPNRILNFHTHFSIGYRYQKKSGGLFFRCAYTPILEFNRYFRHWAGISIGYSF